MISVPVCPSLSCVHPQTSWSRLRPGCSARPGPWSKTSSTNAATRWRWEPPSTVGRPRGRGRSPKNIYKIHRPPSLSELELQFPHERRLPHPVTAIVAVLLKHWLCVRPCGRVATPGSRLMSPPAGEFVSLSSVGLRNRMKNDPDEAVRKAYGNFDIIFDHSARIPQPHTTLHTPCDMFYLVPMLIGCWSVL